MPRASLRGEAFLEHGLWPAPGELLPLRATACGPALADLLPLRVMDREFFEHYLGDTSRRGPAADGAFTGAAGGAACGDLSRISFMVEGGRIAGVSFDTEGCGAMLAATAAVAEMVDGAPVLDAARISIDDVDAALGGLTPAKRHAAQLSSDALHRALTGAAASALPLDGSVGAGAATQDAVAAGAETEAAAVTAGPHRVAAPSSSSTSNVGFNQAADSRGTRPERVAVAMSGGVDSAVAALLERERGAEVVAITVKLWADSGHRRHQGLLLAGGGARAPVRSRTRSASRTSRSTSRRNSAAASSGASSPATPKARRRTPASLCNGEVRLAAMIDLAERLGADAPADRPLRPDRRGRRRAAAGLRRRRGQGPELHAGGAAAGAARAPRLPADRDDQGRGARDRRTPRPLGRAASPRARTSASSPARASAASCAATADSSTATAPIVDRSGRTLGRHRGHHNFTVGQRRGIGVSAARAALRARHRRRRQHGHGRHPGRARNAAACGSATPSCTGTAPASTRSACATTRAPCRLRSAAAARGRHEALEIELGEQFAGASPGQTAVLLEGETIVGHGTIAAPA